jgi:hypothetical protein
MLVTKRDKNAQRGLKKGKMLFAQRSSKSKQASVA